MGRHGVALGLLGLETWALVALLPRLRLGWLGAAGWLELGAIGMPLALLALGLAPASWLAVPARRLALVVGVPVSLAASVAMRPDLTERDAFGPMTVALLALSLALYLVLALDHVERPEAVRDAPSQPLPAEAHQGPPAAGRFGRLVLGLGAAAGVGAMAVALHGGRAEALQRFGEAADDVTAFAVLVGALLASIAIGAVIGPALRARKRSDPGRERLRVRLLPALAFAALALLLRGVLAYLDAS